MREAAAAHVQQLDDLARADLGRVSSSAPCRATNCRGPFCVYADDAVRLLTSKGRRAVRLEDGFPEWAAKRLPIDRTEPHVKPED